MKKSVIYVIALFLQVYKLIKIKLTLSMYSKLIKQVIRLDVLSISQLKNKITNNLLKVGDAILCTGQLKASEPMKSVLYQNKNVVYSNVIMEKVFEIGDNRNIIRKHIRTLISGFLRLWQDDSHIKIFQTANTEMICTNMLKTKVAYRQKIFNFGWLLSILFKSPTRAISNVYYQSYIPQNCQTVLFTKISKNMAGDIQFVKPIAIAKSKIDILQFYAVNKGSHKYLFYLLHFSIAITVYLILKHVVQPLWHKNINKVKSQVNNLQKIQIRDYNCCKCQKVLSNIINSPCGHLNVCSDCNVKQSNCLECDKKTKGIIIVYPC